MNLVLYNSTAENNRVDKSGCLKEVVTLSGTLRNSSSVVNPVITLWLSDRFLGSLIQSNAFVVEDHDSRFVNADNRSGNWSKLVYEYRTKVLACNYAFIPEFNRYYFVTDVVTLQNDMYSISLRCDVLMTYRLDIMNQSAFINRSESNYSPDLVDNLYPVRFDKETEETELGVEEKGTNDIVIDFSDLPTVTYWDSKLGYWTEGDVVAVGTFAYFNNPIGANVQFSESKPDSSVLMSANFNQMFPLAKIRNSYYGLSWYGFTDGGLTWLNQLSAGDEDSAVKLRSSLVSLVRYPFKIDDLLITGTARQWITQNPSNMSDYWTSILRASDINYKYSDSVGRYNYYLFHDLSITGPQNVGLVSSFYLIGKYSSYLDYEPYSTYELYLPYYGWISLNATGNLGSLIKVYYIFDWVTTNATIAVTNETKGKLIFKGSCNIGTDVNLMASNVAENNKSRLSNILNLGISSVSYGVNALASGLTGNAVGMAMSATSMAKAVKDYNTTDMSIVDKATYEMTTPSLDGWLPKKCRLRVNYPTEIMDSTGYNEFVKMVGKPCHRFYSLRKLSGFTQIGDIHLDGFATATDSEKAEIESILKTGIIL